MRDEIDTIAKYIAIENDKEELLEKLKKVSSLRDKSDKDLEELCNLNFSKYINLSLKALEKILPLMREGKRYNEAREEVGLKEYRKLQEPQDFLPPLCESIYAERLTNPVVARAVAQYRKVLNALLKEYGPVHKIHIEFTREIGSSKKQKQAYTKAQNENLEKKKEAEKQCEILGLEISDSNILKLRLFLEQKEYCAYSGKKITHADLKDPTALQIDHIYPYSRSFDDSYMNKVLVFTKENQNKGNKTPFEAFGSDKEKWQTIESLALNLPYKKMKRMLNRDFKDKESGFIARNLNDTSYIARLVSSYTKDYLRFLTLADDEVTIAGEKGSKVHVESISGALSQMLRHFVGFDDKDRTNHLHHAIDAVLVACINKSMIQRFSNFKKMREQNKAKVYAKEIKESDYKDKRTFFMPCEYFREKVLEKVDKIFVSKPPRKRAKGALHEETFYSWEQICKEFEGNNKRKKIRTQEEAENKAKIALKNKTIRKLGNGKFVKNEKMPRLDIFRHKQSGKFYGVPIYTMDFAQGILPNKAAVQGKSNGVIKDWIEMDEKYEFCFSLFKDDLIAVQKSDMEKPELGYYIGFDSANAQINIAKHDNKDNLTPNQQKLFGKSIGIQNLKTFKKYIVSPLGKHKEAESKPRENIAIKHRNRKVKSKINTQNADIKDTQKPTNNADSPSRQ